MKNWLLALIALALIGIVILLVDWRQERHAKAEQERVAVENRILIQATIAEREAKIKAEEGHREMLHNIINDVERQLKILGIAKKAEAITQEQYDQLWKEYDAARDQARLELQGKFIRTPGSDEVYAKYLKDEIELGLILPR